MPDSLLRTPTARETAERARLAAQLRRAADHLEWSGLHDMRMLDARDICLGALNELDRSRDYGRPGKSIDDLLGPGSL